MLADDPGLIDAVRTALAMVLAAAYAWITLRAASAAAAVYFVDGACATSGTGENLDCGAAGAFRTIGDGIRALQPGDTLNVRGAYAGDGVDAPADGAWSYHPRTHRIVVNPFGQSDPAATIFVPHFGWNVHIRSPSHVTLR